jgi:hypothetical protein
MNGHGAQRAAALLLALVALSATAFSAGCARVGTPGGGPPDTTPPEVVKTVPAADSTGVPRDTEIRLEFSEDMNRVSAERAFSLEPQTELKNLRWDGRALVAVPETELPDSTTFTVRLSDAALDHHEVSLAAPFELTFSTGPTLDTGAIEGVVRMSGAAVPDATVWACRRAPTTAGGVIRSCRYATTTGVDGTFMLTGLAASERPYFVLAFIDTDGDNVYTVRDEIGRIAENPALVDSMGAVVTGILVELSDESGLLPVDGGEEEQPGIR